jgi:peroxiredoxin Q/BCP
MATLTLGSKAPAFTLHNQKGEKVSLKDYKGQKLVLFFYPKDMTPTCTVEACNLRDNVSLLAKQGIQVIGISPDDVKSHEKFSAQQQLPYPILADDQKKVVEKYGVWGEKSLYGNKYMGVLRTTFLINEKGVIVEIIDKVKSKDHAAQILKIWQKLDAKP